MCTQVSQPHFGDIFNHVQHVKCPGIRIDLESYESAATQSRGTSMKKNCYDNISISLNSTMLKIFLYVFFLKHVTWHVLSIASAFYFVQSSELKFVFFTTFFISFGMYSKRTEKNTLLDRNINDYYVTACFRHGNPEVNSAHTDGNVLPIWYFIIAKKLYKLYYHHAQHVDIDFGQVHIV